MFFYHIKYMIRNTKVIFFVIIFFLLSILYNTITLEGFDMRKELNEIQIEKKANDRKIATIVFSSIFGAIVFGVAIMALSNTLKIDEEYKKLKGFVNTSGSEQSYYKTIMDTIRKYVPGLNR